MLPVLGRLIGVLSRIGQAQSIYNTTKSTAQNMLGVNQQPPQKEQIIAQNYQKPTRDNFSLTDWRLSVLVAIGPIIVVALITFFSIMTIGAGFISQSQ